MSDKMMRICGKNPDGNASAIRVDADGNARIKRIWETAEQTVCELIRNSDALVESTGEYVKYSGVLDVSDWGMVSLRIANNLSVPASIHFQSDYTYSSEKLATNIDGDDVTFTVQPNTETIVTPDDLPVLNYLRYIKIRLAAKNTQASDEGKTVTAIIIKKR